jgi:Ni2+-binding GTPase involved in maturation of urease and hydrogenase
VAVVTKIDLAAAVEFDWDAALANIQAVRPNMGKHPGNETGCAVHNELNYKDW